MEVSAGRSELTRWREMAAPPDEAKSIRLDIALPRVSMLNSRLLPVGLCLLLVSASALCSRAAGPQNSKRAKTEDLLVREFYTRGAKSAVEQGLEYLAREQKPDGSIGSGPYGRNVAVTALSGMAFLAAGHTPGRGKYGRNVQNAVDFVLSRCHSNGYITDRQNTSHGPMYGHGFATLFLTQVYGMSTSKELGAKVRAATKLIINSQNKDGGWRYEPGSNEADVSVTVCQIMALRAARNCGIHVPKETIDLSVKYIKRCQNIDGGFRYRLPFAQSEFPRSAAAVVALYSAGDYDGREATLGIKYLMRYVPERNAFRRQKYYFYGHYYAVQAMWQRGGEPWKRWYPAIRDELLGPEHRIKSGGWRDASICNEYGTAMACLILQTPSNYLPIFHR